MYAKQALRSKCGALHEWQNVACPYLTRFGIIISWLLKAFAVDKGLNKAKFKQDILDRFRQNCKNRRGVNICLHHVMYQVEYIFIFYCNLFCLRASNVYKQNSS